MITERNPLIKILIILGAVLFLSWIATTNNRWISDRTAIIAMLVGILLFPLLVFVFRRFGVNKNVSAQDVRYTQVRAITQPARLGILLNTIAFFVVLYLLISTAMRGGEHADQLIWGYAFFSVAFAVRALMSFWRLILWRDRKFKK